MCSLNQAARRESRGDQHRAFLQRRAVGLSFSSEEGADDLEVGVAGTEQDAWRYPMSTREPLAHRDGGYLCSVVHQAAFAVYSPSPRREMRRWLNPDGEVRADRFEVPEEDSSPRS